MTRRNTLNKMRRKEIFSGPLSDVKSKAATINSNSLANVLPI